MRNVACRGSEIEWPRDLMTFLFCSPSCLPSTSYMSWRQHHVVRNAPVLVVDGMILLYVDQGCCVLAWIHPRPSTRGMLLGCIVGMYLNVIELRWPHRPSSQYRRRFGPPHCSTQLRSSTSTSARSSVQSPLHSFVNETTGCDRSARYCGRSYESFKCTERILVWARPSFRPFSAALSRDTFPRFITSNRCRLDHWKTPMTGKIHNTFFHHRSYQKTAA